MEITLVTYVISISRAWMTMSSTDAYLRDAAAERLMGGYIAEHVYTNRISPSVRKDDDVREVGSSPRDEPCSISLACSLEISSVSARRSSSSSETSMPSRCWALRTRGVMNRCASSGPSRMRT